MSPQRPQRLCLFLLLAGLALLALAPSRAAALSDADIAAIDSPTTATQSAQRTAQPPSLPGLLGRMTLALGAVFGLMAGSLWLAKRYLPKSVTKTIGRGGAIEILATRSLGQRKSLVLVRSHDKTMLLGVTSQAIQFLAEVDQDPALWQEAALRSGLDDDETPPRRGTTSLEDPS